MLGDYIVTMPPPATVTVTVRMARERAVTWPGGASPSRPGPGGPYSREGGPYSREERSGPGGEKQMSIPLRNRR